MAGNARRAAKAMLVVLAAAYPIFVYFALIHWHWDVRYLAGALIALLLLRMVLGEKTADKVGAVIYPLLIAVLGFSIMLNSDLGVRFYPVLINLAMLYTFAMSLLFPPTVIERLARIGEPDLPETGIRYTRQLTKVWCLFFFLNGSIAGYTALFSSYEIWAWYNGFIAYVAIGLMFLIEYPIRLYVKKREQVK